MHEPMSTVSEASCEDTSPRVTIELEPWRSASILFWIATIVSCCGKRWLDHGTGHAPNTPNYGTFILLS